MGPKLIGRLLDTLCDFDKLKHGEVNKKHIYSSKTDMGHVNKLFFKDKSINGPRVIKMLLNTLSKLVKLNYGKYSKYQLCASKIDMAQVHILFFKDKSI